MQENLSRAQRRRQKRESSRLKKLENQKLKNKSSFLKVTIFLLIVIAIPVFWYINKGPKGPEVPNNEVTVPIMNVEHTSNTDNVIYNSNPPTSGPHFGNWHKEWKFYETELPTGGLIHNMEHGGVVLYYKPSVDEGTKAQLKDFTEDNFKIIASANEDIPAQMTLAAWGVYELFDSFDEAKFKRFYKKHLNHGPENVYP